MTGRSAVLSGSVKVFTVKAGCALEAITYVNGYGGYTVTDFFPRLTEFCRELGVTTVTNGIYDSRTIVPFREVFHDAVDLGHTYHVCKDDSVSCVSVTKEIGLHSLQCARQTLAITKDTSKCCWQARQTSGRTLGQRGTLVSNSLRQIEAGYSFPVNDPPWSYVSAELEARQCVFRWTTLKYNSLVYNGMNLGRFVNQGGLEEGLKALCQEVEQKQSPDMMYVKGFMKESSNVKYVRHGTSLQAYSSREIPRSQQACMRTML